MNVLEKNKKNRKYILHSKPNRDKNQLI